MTLLFAWGLDRMGYTLPDWILSTVIPLTVVLALPLLVYLVLVHIFARAAPTHARVVALITTLLPTVGVFAWASLRAPGPAGDPLWGFLAGLIPGS